MRTLMRLPAIVFQIANLQPCRQPLQPYDFSCSTTSDLQSGHWPRATGSKPVGGRRAAPPSACRLTPSVASFSRRISQRQVGDRACRPDVEARRPGPGSGQFALVRQVQDRGPLGRGYRAMLQESPDLVVPEHMAVGLAPEHERAALPPSRAAEASLALDHRLDRIAGIRRTATGRSPKGRRGGRPRRCSGRSPP